MDVAEGETVVFDKVVAYCNRALRVGTPYVKGDDFSCLNPVLSGCKSKRGHTT